MKTRINRKILLIVTIILITTIIDQLMKVLIINKLYRSSMPIIKGVLDLTYVENTGGAFGIGNNNILFFVIINVIVIGILGKLILLKKDEINTISLISISLIIAGGIGNLMDRVFRGYVIDYIDISPLIKYPIFNFADICVVVGVFFLIIDLIINRENVIKENSNIV